MAAASNCPARMTCTNQCSATVRVSSSNSSDDSAALSAGVVTQLDGTVVYAEDLDSRRLVGVDVVSAQRP